MYIALLEHVKEDVEEGEKGRGKEEEVTEKRVKKKKKDGERGDGEEKNDLVELEEDVSSSLHYLLQVALSLRGEPSGAQFS